MKALIAVDEIGRRIYSIRGHRVMLDRDLAELYGVETSNLNKAVRRNIDRFPGDFMLQLTGNEAQALRFQIGMSKPGRRGGRRYLPYAFTEQGVAMLSGVLHSKRAVQVNIEIMRAFVRLRQIMSSHKDLALRLDELEARYDAQFKIVFREIREQLRPPARPKERIGFRLRGKCRESGRRHHE